MNGVNGSFVHGAAAVGSVPGPTARSNKNDKNTKEKNTKRREIADGNKDGRAAKNNSRSTAGTPAASSNDASQVLTAGAATAAAATGLARPQDRGREARQREAEGSDADDEEVAH